MSSGPKRIGWHVIPAQIIHIFTQLSIQPLPHPPPQLLHPAPPFLSLPPSPALTHPAGSPPAKFGFTHAVDHPCLNTSKDHQSVLSYLHSDQRQQNQQIQNHRHCHLECGRWFHRLQLPSMPQLVQMTLTLQAGSLVWCEFCVGPNRAAVTSTHSPLTKRHSLWQAWRRLRLAKPFLWSGFT